jgi:hypothetical protein
MEVMVSVILRYRKYTIQFFKEAKMIGIRDLLRGALQVFVRSQPQPAAPAYSPIAAAHEVVSRLIEKHDHHLDASKPVAQRLREDASPLKRVQAAV